MVKNEDSIKRLIAFVAIFVFLIEMVSAADVAYIYKKEFRIDQNIVDLFEDNGLSVDLIKETNL